MTEIKDKRRRITGRTTGRLIPLRNHANELINGGAMEGQLGFVAGKEPGYFDVIGNNPQLANPNVPMSPIMDGSGGTGTVSSPAPVPPVLTGRPTVNPMPTPTPPPTTTLPVNPPLTTSPTTPMPTILPTDTAPTSPGTSTPAVASPQPPVANAGPNQTITGSTASLNGSVSSDPQNSQLTFNWAVVSAPNVPLIASSNGPQTTVSGLIAGTYVFKLYVYNAQGLENDSTTSVTVIPADNSGATVNTGVTTLNTGSAVITTTAPIGGAGSGPYRTSTGAGANGGGGGGGSSSNASDAVPPTMWQKVWSFTKNHWLLLTLVVVGTGYVIWAKKEQ